MNQAQRDAKNARRRALRASSPEHKAKDRAGVEARTWQQQMLYNAASRSKRLGVPFDLTKDDLVVPEFCPVLGIPLQQKRHRRPGPNTPSLDRFVPELGYTRGNVAIISFRANRLKNDASHQELLAVANWLGAKIQR